MATNTAVIEHRSAKIADDFGLDWAMKLFGAEAIDSLPKFVRGPNKGKPKGFIHWCKASKGGWTNEHGVVTPGLVEAWIGLSMYTLRNDALSGKWLGRVQNLAGRSFYMFEEGRQRDADYKAKVVAEWAAEKAEILAEIADSQR